MNMPSPDADAPSADSSPERSQHPASTGATGPEAGSRAGIGLVLIHGFTGTPASMQPIADAARLADLPVEQPVLAGHGTEIADMVDCTWDDWMADVAAAIQRLLRRCERVVLCGQSMGASLALGSALLDRESGTGDIVGLVCINPLTRPRAAAEVEMIDELIEDGMEIAPGGESDIADPDAQDVGYCGTPLRAIRSVLVSGIEPMSHRYGAIEVPLQLYTSRQDHVVDPADSDFLAATYGGAVTHVWLERGYHVAAVDFDRSIIASGVVEFVRSVAE